VEIDHPAPAGIGVIQLGGCELHGGIMTENGDWLVGVRGCLAVSGPLQY